MFNSIGIATTGLDAADAWMTTTADNVANASTPGYSSETPTLAADPALGGVTVTGISTSGGPVDLSIQIPNLVMATDVYALNLAVVQRAAAMYQDITQLGSETVMPAQAL